MDFLKDAPLALSCLIFAVAFLTLSLRRGGGRIVLPVFSILVTMALLNGYAELRFQLFPTGYWPTSALLALFFGATYTYFLLNVCYFLGVREWRRSVSISLLPFVYLAFVGVGFVFPKAERLENPPLALFVFLVLAVSIHAVLFAAVLRSALASVPGLSINQNVDILGAELDRSLAGLGILMLGLVLLNQLHPVDFRILVLDCFFLAIFFLLLVVVRKESKLRIVNDRPPLPADSQG